MSESSTPQSRGLFWRGSQRALLYASVYGGARGWKAGRPLRGPVYAQIGIADPCNHRCVMCPYHPPEKPVSALTNRFGGAAPGLMPVERFERVAADLAQLGTIRVDLVGRGEPTLHPELPRMVSFATRQGLEVAMTTNGSRLDDALVAALVNGGISSVKISLNAGRRSTYPLIHTSESPERYDAVLDGVRRLTSAGPRSPEVTLSFAVSRLNVEELVEMVERAHETGARSAYFQHLIPVRERPELSLEGGDIARLATVGVPAARRRAAELGVETNLKDFLDEALSSPDEGAVPCYVGYYFTTIIGNGNVLPCCQTDRAVGNLSEAGFAEVWNGSEYGAFREAARRLPMRSPALETAECEDCYFRPHNVTVHRVAYPLDGVGQRAFRWSQALRLNKVDGR